MKRREFITLLGGAAAAWPLAARAQQGERMRRIGVLHGRRRPDDPDAHGPHRCVPARRCSNWVGPTAETCRSTIAGARAMPTDIRKYAAELVALAPDVILATGTPSLAPLLQATRTVPIVFVSVADPVGAGFVDSLARPGGNATGFIAVRIQLEREMAGTAQRDRAGRDASGGPSGSRHNRRDRPVRRDPVRGAVARGGGEPGQRARRGRDRARRRGLRALRQWRPDRDGGARWRSFIAI